jgi:hypothetical protein
MSLGWMAKVGHAADDLRLDLLAHWPPIFAFRKVDEHQPLGLQEQMSCHQPWSHGVTVNHISMKEIEFEHQARPASQHPTDLLVLHLVWTYQNHGTSTLWL